MCGSRAKPRPTAGECAQIGPIRELQGAGLAWTWALGKGHAHHQSQHGPAEGQSRPTTLISFLDTLAAGAGTMVPGRPGTAAPSSGPSQVTPRCPLQTDVRARPRASASLAGWSHLPSLQPSRPLLSSSHTGKSRAAVHGYRGAASIPRQSLGSRGLSGTAPALPTAREPGDRGSQGASSSLLAHSFCGSSSLCLHRPPREGLGPCLTHPWACGQPRPHPHSAVREEGAGWPRRLLAIP